MGIGAAIVRAHAARGDNVVFTYWSSADDAKALVAELGDRVVALRSAVVENRTISPDNLPASTSAESPQL